MRSIGIDRLVVSKLLNHAEGGVTRIYDRYAADPEKAAAMERWANRLRDIIENKPVENIVQFKADIEAGLVKIGDFDQREGTRSANLCRGGYYRRDDRLVREACRSACGVPVSSIGP